MRSEGEHEQLVEILKVSFIIMREKVFSVNIPNEGAIPNLPEHSSIEMHSSYNRRGINTTSY